MFGGHNDSQVTQDNAAVEGAIPDAVMSAPVAADPMAVPGGATLPAPEGDAYATDDQQQAVATPMAEPAAAPAVAMSTDDATADDLLQIKQQALQQLSPLVGHLDQSPEEKFRTTMMMIQASDNQALIKDAYAAAQAITDEKTRAQALLDIVNEINYFTNQSQQA